MIPIKIQQDSMVHVIAKLWGITYPVMWGKIIKPWNKDAPPKGQRLLK